MSYHSPDAQALHRRAGIAEAFVAWLRAEADALLDAADLLGGPDWARRARRVVEALGAGASAATLLPDLEALHRLLTLEMTDDPFGPEAARFMAVHPDDPRADAARLCAEALARGVAALHELAAMDLASRGEAA